MERIVEANWRPLEFSFGGSGWFGGATRKRFCQPNELADFPDFLRERI
jgi:hypothetical protein